MLDNLMNRSSKCLLMTDCNTCRRSKPLAQILLLDQGRSIKRKLDTGVHVYDNKVKKKQRYTKTYLMYEIINVLTYLMYLPKLDTGVEVYNNKLKKEQRQATSEKLNMYIMFLIKETNISIRKANLHQGNKD